MIFDDITSVTAGATRLKALYQDSRLDEAEELAQTLLTQYPREPFFANVLGNVRKQAGDIAGAAAAYEQAIEINPAFQEAWINAGHIAIAQLQFDRSLDCFEKAHTLRPDCPDAWFGRAKALQLCGDTAAAEKGYRRAIELKPDFALAWNNLGCLYQETKQLTQSEECLRRALALKPEHPEALLNLSVTLGQRGRHEEAERVCRQALLLNPEGYSNHNNLGKILCDSGHLAPAVDCYREALRLAPEQLSVYSNLLFTLNYLDDADPVFLYEEARQFGVSASRLATQAYDDWRVKTDGEHLRVGFVSGDLINHPVGYFLENVLRYLDSNRIELVAFPTHSRSDELTERIRPFFSAWHPLTALDDAAAAALIRATGVHILVDLAGHTGHNRLPVFAWRPAPVQVSWLGYFATTGLDTMDYLLADPMGVPLAQQCHFSERIEYLPDTRLCFTPPTVALEPNALPALKNGLITFGCFQKLTKITDAVLALWGEVMTAIPASRLLIQNQALNDPAVCEAVQERLQKVGIAPDRIKLLGDMHRDLYLRQHHAIDFLLDTFPYPGGTTTCEALWMGVPTLTLAGETLLARQGASLLQAVGLPEWVVESRQEFVARACEIAADLPGLNALRGRLRAQLLASPLCDAPRFARQLEAAFFRMWERHPLAKL